MRKSFTRLFGVFILLCMMSLQVVAQSTSTFGYSLSPTDGKYPVSVTQGDFVITMNTPVKAVYDGTISLNNYNGTEYVPCQLRPGYETAAGSGIFVAPAGSENAWRVEFSGNKVIINFDYDLGEFQNYYITVSESAIQNASGTLRFVGLKAGSIALTSGNDAGYDWDFTTEDLTPPTPVWSAFNAVAPKTDPTDEEVNVSPSLTTFTLEFSEDVKFKSGITSAANLSVGDIALYESTDVGVYGGDVVYATPSAISISGKVLSITWPGVLPSMAKLYVRIKPGIITDLQGLAFAGFNTNGVGANIGWNFSTKDARVPNVTFAAVTPCNTTNFTANTNFTITLDEIGIVLGNGNRTPITAANIKSYIQFSGGDFSVTSVAEVAGSTVITIDPAAALTSGTVYTISLTAGLWDSGDNAIPAKLSQNLVAGDYTAPTTDILAWKNPDGTSFNINLRVNNEPAGTTTRYYYIVVKASDVATSANADYYKPESLTNLLAAANTTAAFPTDVKTSISTTVPTTYAYYPWVGSTTVTTDDRYIPIFQRGDIFAPANTELLEHVVQLPASHGTDWVVYLFGADGSLCGSNTVTGLFSATANVTTIQKLTPSTFDILVPEVTFSAELVDAVHDTIDGCSEKLQVIAGDDNIAKGIKRNGPVYIHFNEAIETNMGAAITGAHIASSVTLIDNASNTYTIDAARSSYDAANKKMIIYPTTPFASGVQLTVTLLSNKIQDAQDLERFGPNGTELMVAQQDDFCVESYVGPVVTFDPCAVVGELDRSGDIVIRVDQDLYAPSYDGGGLLSNDSAAANFVGRYIQVRKHGQYPVDMVGPNTEALRDAGDILYHGENPNAYFLNKVNITVAYPTSGDGDSTVITISPKDKSEVYWESETWYSVELEQNLQSKDYLDLADVVDTTYFDDCTISNYWAYFRAEDSRNPIVIFYEDENNLLVNDGLGTVDTDVNTNDPLLDGNVTVQDTSNILVSIDEWVLLGFDGFKDLTISDVIDDANALRRYFALYEVNAAGNIPISFDVKLLSLDPNYPDNAQFFIDPYYATSDGPNWTKGKTYRVCFIDNPAEFEQYRDDPALTDDNLNALAEACATFTCPADPVAPECLVSATINGQALNLATSNGLPVTEVAVTADSIVTLQLCFDVPVDLPTTGEVAIRLASSTAVQTAAMSAGVRSGDYKCITYTFDMHSAEVLNPEWAENSVYDVYFSGTNLITNSIAGCSFPAVQDPFNDIQTLDGSAPYIVSFIPDQYGNPYSTICLGDKDSTDILIQWNEPVWEQTGKKLEIWRRSTNSIIATLDASTDTTAAGDVYMKIPNSLFKGLLAYNESYYIHIPVGFVKNEVGLANATVTTNDSLTFCVGPDPAPSIVCGGFTPAHWEYTGDRTPNLTLTFSEPVAPVTGTGLSIQIYNHGVAYTPVDAYLHVSPSVFVAVAGSNNTKWRLNTENALAAAGIHNDFAWGSCYDVNISAGAFREINGTQTTPALVTNDLNGSLTVSACPWTFCIGDNTPPTVEFWPVNKTPNVAHVATNAHLYAYISELPVIDTIATSFIENVPLNVNTVKQFFSLVKMGESTVSGLDSIVSFDIEFVGNDIPNGDNQKQRIRIVPRDQNGPDWSLSSSTPSLQAESWYRLSILNPVPSVQLVDINGNLVDQDGFTEFLVEDITCPEIDGPLAETAVTTGSLSKVAGSLNEAGKVRWVVVKNGVSAPAASAVWAATYTSLGLARGEAATTGAGNDFKFEFTIDANDATGYDYDVFVYAQDDEVDLFDTDAEIFAEWPYADAVKGFETEPYRIKDLRVAPNWCTTALDTLDVQFCDNDAPIIVGTYPIMKGISDADREMSFPIGDSIVLKFNEPIQVNDNDLTGWKIVLRDANNNIGVPLAYSVGLDSTITLYPLDSLSVADEAEALQDYASLTGTVVDLAQERDYYLEIDRWAVSDDGGCNGALNYFGEWVGKEKLAFRTEDMTGPCLVDHRPQTEDCVEPEADIILTFKELNQVLINPNIANADSAYIYIYRVGEVIPHERIHVSRITGPVKNAAGNWVFTAPTAYTYLAKGIYQVRVPANMFMDNAGNFESCLNGHTWTFTVRDYEAPIASWTIIQDYSYLNVAITDPEYNGLIVSGPAGATQNNVPTSSLLKIEFNEEVYVWDNESTAENKWTAMNLVGAKDEVAASISIRETAADGTVTPLTYDSDGYGTDPVKGNWEFQEIGADYAIIRIYRAEDHWMPFLTSPFADDLGLKSNATYTVAVAPNVYSDLYKCDDEEIHNIYNGNNPLVVINTRDDVPPTLTITDSGNVDVCANQCVQAESPIKLHFSGKVVKTPYAGIDYDASNPSTWPSDDVNWWTNSNLPLSQADLMATLNGDFLRFYSVSAKGSTVAIDSVVLSSVTVDANGQDITLNLASPLASQGWYYIEFLGGTVKDQKRVPDGNEFIGKSCWFRVEDTVLPYVIGTYPADDADGVTTHISNILTPQTLWGGVFGGDSMAVLFNEPIAKSNSAEKIVVRRTNGQIFDEIGISECTVDKQNPAVLVLPVNALEEFTGYYVEIPAGFVTDTTACTKNGNIAIDPEVPYKPGNRFAWNFTTADDTPPTPIVYIPNDTDTVPRNSNLSIRFDENIYADYANCSNANVYIYHHDNTVGWVGDPAIDFGNVVEVIPFWSTTTIPNYTLTGSNTYNGFNNDIITFNPVSDFTRIGTYYIRVSGDCIRDAQNNFWEGLGDSTTWKFTVTNDIAPVLAATTPAYDHMGARWEYVELPADDHGFVIADLSMEFVTGDIHRDPLMVAPGAGSIKIMEYRYNAVTMEMEEKLWKEYDINDPAIEFNSNVVTINDVLLRDNINKPFGQYEECYYVLAEPGVVTNGYPGSNTFWAGIDNAFVWRFQTAADDVFVPGYEIVSPNSVEDGDAAMNLTIDEAKNLVVKFNEGVEALLAPTGKVQVFVAGASAPVEEVTVTSSMTSDSTLTVPLTKLVDETSYIITVQAGAFGDTSTVSTPNFAFGGEGVWEFRTGDNTAPYPVTFSPAEGDDCVAAAPQIVLTFNESFGVTRGSGSIEVVDAEGTVYDMVEAADTVNLLISEDGNTVTINVAGLPDTTALTVNVPEGFFFDGDEHSPLANEDFSLSFTTGENSLPEVVITPAAVTTADTVLVLTFNEVVNAVADKFVTVGEKEIAAEDFATEDNLVFTYALTALESETEYTVTIEEGAFVDLNEGCTPNDIAETVATFTVGDLTAPEVVGSPVQAADYQGLVLSLNFDDAVTATEGNVVIYSAAGDTVEVVDVTTLTPNADKTVYTFEPENVRFGTYYILIDSAAFVDNTAAPAGVTCAGISDPDEWTLIVKDPEFVNCYNIIAPKRAATGVELETTVIIDFCDERIVPGENGIVTIADQSQDRVLGVNYFEYPVTAEMINGNTLSIDVTGLQELTTYSIIIPFGAIEDEGGNPFVGITDANLWIFTTGDFTDPIVSVEADTVMNDGTGEPVAITSSEAGKVYLAREDVNPTATALNAAVSADKAVTATLTAAGTVEVDVEGLLVGNYKAYAIDASGRIGVAENIVVVTEPTPVPLVRISAIQGTSETSPLAGDEVRTQGTVTAVTSTGFYMQDANAAWSGIFVASTTAVSEGQSVEVTGTVAEVGGITTINNVSKVDYIAPVVSTDPIVVTSITENYESVWVKVTGRAAATANVSGDWTAGTFTINNALYGSYPVEKDYNYEVAGIAQANKVLAIEIVNLSKLNGKEDYASSVKVYPNPFDKFITLEVSSDIVITKAVITNIAGQLVKEVINPDNTISTSELRSGVYFISLHSVDGIAKTERIIKR